MKFCLCAAIGSRKTPWMTETILATWEVMSSTKSQKDNCNKNSTENGNGIPSLVSNFPENQIILKPMKPEPQTAIKLQIQWRRSTYSANIGQK